MGRYTLNAVLSQSFDARLPILEANSQRVLSRLAGLDGDPKDAAVQKQLWKLADSLLPDQAVGDFNQSLMELGALVCTPTQPNCAACPLSSVCAAKKQNRQHEIPARSKPADTRAIDEVAVVVRKRNRVLLVQRPREGRWPGMWEFPHHPIEWIEPHDAAAHRLLADLGMAGDLRGEIATIRHSVTRFRITMICLHVAHRRGRLRIGAFPNAAWVRVEDLHGYPLATPQRRLARCLLAIGRGRENTQRRELPI